MVKEHKPRLHSRLERFAKLKKLVSAPASGPTPGVVYIGHLPDGFEEEELRRFFLQFGTVKRAKLSRSKKTGRSRGFGFIEFEDKEVARIAANTMHGLILFSKQLVCQLAENVHHFALMPCKRRPIDTYEKFREKYNTQEDSLAVAQRVQRLLAKEKELREKLQEQGIKYDFGGFKGELEQNGVKVNYN